MSSMYGTIVGGVRCAGSIRGNPRAVDAFAQMNAGSISPAEFFARIGPAPHVGDPLPVT